MWRKHKELRSRWKVSYRAGENMVGSKKVSELVPNTPGNQFVYATVELSALEPDYVALGRVGRTTGRSLKLLIRSSLTASENSRNRSMSTDATKWTNNNLTKSNRRIGSSMISRTASCRTPRMLKVKDPTTVIGGGNGPPVPPPPPPPPRGEVPERLEIGWAEDQVLRIGRGVEIRLASLVRPRAVDSAGRTVPKLTFEWTSNDRHVVEFVGTDAAIARGKGRTTIFITVAGTSIRSREIPVEVWNVDHVLLTPRSLELPLGKRKQIVAEVTQR